MSSKKQKKVLTAAVTAVLLMQPGLTGAVGAASAQEDVPLSLYERTAPALETEEGAAVYANLKINGKLDYGNYGIERSDISGVSYVFAVTTKDETEALINEEQLAYCVQSYFLTPLAGDHSAEMTDQVSAVNGGRNLHKVIYYGYGGAGYDEAEFEAFLASANGSYYENVYMQLSEEEQMELCYILTHSAASYAYFNDGTDFEEYLKLQFEVKYKEDWERQYGYFKGPELENAGVLDGDMNLFGSTYGMTAEGITLVKGWYELLTSRADPGLRVTETEEGFVFEGNEKNEELKLDFVVPEGFICEISDESGAVRQAAEDECVSVRPGEEFWFACVDDIVSTEADGISDLIVELDGTLAGTEKEVWNLVLLETNKGTDRTVDKRQQDIAAASMTDAGRTELDFVVGLEKGSISVQVADEVQQPVSGAVLGIFYDESCSVSVEQKGEPVQLITDAQGSAYLELIINQKLEENGGHLYVKQLSAPDGNAADETVLCVELNSSAALLNERVFEAVEVPVSCQVNLTGRALKEGEFRIELIPVTDAAGETAVPDGAVVSAANDTDGRIVFEGVSVSEPGNYYYKMVSENGSFIAVAEVTADEINKGQLNVSLTYPEGQPQFEETYEASGEAVLEGIQVILENDVLEAGEFVFELKDEEGNVLQSAGNDAAGQVVFEGIAYTQEDIGKEYVYTVSQAAGEGASAAVDKESCTITVKVEDSDGSDGTLKITQEISEAVFENRRVFADAEVPVACQVNLSGRDLKEGEFTFELTQVTDETGASVLEGGAAGTASNRADGSVVFDGIAVDEPGFYYYKVDSEKGSFVAVVEATADVTEKGKLNISITYPEGQPQFEEIYEASGEVLLEGIRVAITNDTLEAGEFTFELKDAQGNVLQTVTSDADGNVVFDSISYTQDDIGKEYVYTVSQVADEAEYNVYEEKECTVTVKVEDSESSDGTLQITQEISEAVFENSRVYEEAEVPVSCQVNLNGRDLKEGEFAFDLVQVTDAAGTTVAENGASGSASNRADGSVVFEGLSISEPGTYYYKVSSEDDSFIAVAEAKANAEHKGQLDITVTYPDGQPQFEETYEAAGKAALEGIQVKLENAALEAGAFEFELKDEAGKVLQRASNDEAGQVVFDAIAYTQEDIGKEYVYTVSQVFAEKADVTYDADTCMITVKVEDSEASDGTLQITQTVDGEVFRNVYVEPETETEVMAEMISETETEESTEERTEEVTESETEQKEERSGFVLPFSISFIILLILWILRLLIRWYRRKNA